MVSEEKEQRLRDAVADTVPDDIELFGDPDGKIHGSDDHGDFQLKPMRGSAEPMEGRCGEAGGVVWHTMERYGQIRYCTALPEKKFVEDGSDFCKNHKGTENLMERHQELFRHGYFASNYANFVEKLPPSKFLFAVEMVGGLFEMSEHNFDINEVDKTIDTSESDLIADDAVEVTLPIPQNTTVTLAANELWTAALKEVMVQNMQEAVFEDGVSQTTVSGSADVDGQITDTIEEKQEHHLHLPLSRVAKDIKEHLKNGGVDADDDDGVITFQKNEYTTSIGPEGAEDAEESGEAATDFHEMVTEDSGEVEVTATE